MMSGANKFVTVAFIVSSFSLPAALSAQERRGASLFVTRKDGQQVKGELIAVQPNSLLLLSAAGKDESVDLIEIWSIVIVRKSHFGTGALAGFLAGALGGAVWGHHQAAGDMPELGAFMGGLIFGAAGGLLGLVAGVGAGLDSEIVLSGQPESVVESTLAKLNRQSRKPGAFAPPQRAREAPAKRETIAGANELPESALRPPATPRFKITWTAAARPGPQMSYSHPYTGTTFRFIGELPSAEIGPFPSELITRQCRPQISIGRLGLAYEWSRHWSSEIELYVPGGYLTDRCGSLEFTSSLDGKKHVAAFGFDETLSSTSLLVGMAFRPCPAAFLQPHVVEAGVAAGPAWVRAVTGRSFPRVSWRETTWAAKIHGAYDFYFVPAFSMGAFAEYRWLNADIPEYGYTEELGFYEGGNYYGDPLFRTTEVRVPGRTISLGGFACGLRIGLSF